MTRTRSRRGVLAACGAGVTTLAGCSAIGDGDEATYDQSDLDLAIRIECPQSAGDAVVVTLSWEWADGAGGSAPDDPLVVSWPDEKWELLSAAHGTTDAVRFDGKGVVDGEEGVRFRHDDAAAEADTTYAASCELSPNEIGPEVAHDVFGRFAHARAETTGTHGEGWFGDVDESWRATAETALHESPCGDAGR